MCELLAFCVFPGRFCRRHRLRTGENVPSVPRDLLLMSEMVLPRFIICIIQYLRDGYTEPGENYYDVCGQKLVLDENLWMNCSNCINLASPKYENISATEKQLFSHSQRFLTF